ncbi:MAG: class I SAM-dependent methyltransferase [Vicinamibacterales bacterium]
MRAKANAPADSRALAGWTPRGNGRTGSASTAPASGVDSFAPYYDLVHDECFGDVFWRLTADTLALVRQLQPPPARLLDLGAGTGRLAVPLSLLGYEVLAVERSAGMAEMLHRRASALGARPSVRRADFAREPAASVVAPGVPYDIAIAAFTVVNYLLSEGELEALALLVAGSLRRGGCMLFDAAERRLFASATYESKQLHREIEVTPLAEPLFRYRDSGTGTTDGKRFAYSEEFTFRYWKPDELLSAFRAAGLRLESEVSHRLRESGSHWFVLRRT